MQKFDVKEEDIEEIVGYRELWMNCGTNNEERYLCFFFLLLIIMGPN